MANPKKSSYYNEIGIKISSLRLSVRFPCAPYSKKEQAEEEDYEVACKNMDHYKSDWTWVPVRSTSVTSVPSVTKNLTMRPLPPPPVPSRAPSPVPALPPYPSSTVSRRSSTSSSKSSRISSYV